MSNFIIDRNGVKRLIELGKKRENVEKKKYNKVDKTEVQKEKYTKK